MLPRLATLVFCAGWLASPGCAQSESPQAFAPGTVIPRVATLANREQSYALYLPSGYSSARRWPAVFVFDPMARGERALRQFRHAAELHGFLVAASNNSRNGPWEPEMEAAEAMTGDAERRFSIDGNRLYFAGFSGGARLSARLAQLCRCAAGVVLSGAGFPDRFRPSPGTRFAVFSAAGNADFNLREVAPLQDELGRTGFPHQLRVFDGSHEWAPEAVLDEALAWFRVQAMKSGLEPPNPEFLAAEFASANGRALAYEQAGDLLSAYRAYRDLAASFDSLEDTGAVRSHAERLESDKAVREALKRERGSFEEQERLGGEILGALSAAAPDRAQAAPEMVRELRRRSLAEKRPERALVLKRALGGVFVGAIESGSEALGGKDYPRAARYFACAAEANPESEWAYRQLAVAVALAGDRKAAVEALRSARKASQDPSGLADWLKIEPAFERLRSSSDFEALLREP